MPNQGTSPPTGIFGPPATPLTLEQSSLHRVRLIAAITAAIAFSAFALGWDWRDGWLVALLAGYEVGHAWYNRHRPGPLATTLLTDIIVVSLAIGIVRPPAVAVITPVVYLITAPMLLTAGTTALRLAFSAVVAASLATYTSFVWSPTITWTPFRSLVMVSSFLAIFGPLILWMVRATSRQTEERERTRRELEATRGRLEETFRSAPVGMELTGIGPTRFLAVNPAFCEFVGYSEEDLLGMSIGDVVHPEDLQAGMARAEMVAAGDLERFEQQRRYIHADGRILWAHFNLSVIRDGAGVPQYAIGQVQDITGRMAAETERDLLLELSLAVAGAVTAEDAMRSVLAGLCSAGGWSIGVLWVPAGEVMKRVHTWAAHPGVDTWSRTTTVLARGEGLVGAVAEERKLIEVPSIAQDHRFVAQDEAASLGLDVAMGVPVIAGEEVVGVLLLLGGQGVDPDGARVTIGAIVAQLGQAIAVKLAEDERDRLAAVLEHTTDFAGFADPEGRIHYINPAGREMLGIGPDEDVGLLHVRDLHTRDGVRHLVEEVMPRVMTEGSWRGESSLRARSGQIIPTSQVILAHNTGPGEVSYLSTVARDISTQKELERQQAAAIRSKDEFIASVSHELRTPLTAVRGFAEILLAQHADLSETECEEMLAVIASESADVSDIVEDLLVAARSDIDQLTISAVRVDLAPVVRETADRVRWEDKTLTLQLPERLSAVVDPLRLRQILRNLMVNAVRYGGQTIQVTASQIGDEVIIAVTDDGAGVTADFREEIFAPYRRAHDRAGLPGSVGLGLAVSRRLARLMNGDVTYARSADWTTFSLQIPAS